jgi:hypothetical protein
MGWGRVGAWEDGTWELGMTEMDEVIQLDGELR